MNKVGKYPEKIRNEAIQAVKSGMAIKDVAVSLSVSTGAIREWCGYKAPIKPPAFRLTIDEIRRCMEDNDAVITPKELVARLRAQFPKCRVCPKTVAGIMRNFNGSKPYSHKSGNEKKRIYGYCRKDIFGEQSTRLPVASVITQLTPFVASVMAQISPKPASEQSPAPMKNDVPKVSVSISGTAQEIANGVILVVRLMQDSLARQEAQKAEIALLKTEIVRLHAKLNQQISVKIETEQIDLAKDSLNS
jgi:hypothetical protein